MTYSFGFSVLNYPPLSCRPAGDEPGGPVRLSGRFNSSFVARVKKDPSPTPPHKGEGLSLPHPQRSHVAKTLPRVLSPLVGEMAAARGGLSLARRSNRHQPMAKHNVIEGAR
jgi:hypothetical protein